MHKILVFLGALIMFAGVAGASPTFRRVVPPDTVVDNVDTFASVALALATSPALAPGAVIQIEPGALPSNLTPGFFNPAAAIAGFTIRGNRDFDASEIPPLVINNDLTVAGANVRLENLNISFGSNNTITINGPGFVLSGNEIHDSAGSNAIRLNGSAALIAGNRIRSVGTGVGAGFVRILAATNTTIQDNEFSLANSQQQIFYETAGAKNDVIERNIFQANRGNVSTAQIFVSAGVTDVTFRHNTFVDYDFSSGAFDIAYGAQNIVIESNRFDFPVGTTQGAVRINSGGSGLTTSFKIAGNDFLLGGSGISMFFASPSTGAFSGVIEGNRFHSATGILFVSSGVSLANVDLGGGSQGSLGANDFQAFTAAATNTVGAIVAGNGAFTISAQNNIFAGNPDQAVFDKTDEGARAEVDTGNPLSGNAAYVGALYSRFLRRAADFQDETGAGAVLAALDDGTKASRVVASLVRSDDALNTVIDDAYRSVLKRGPTDDERQAALGRLRKKTGREEDLFVSLYKTPAANQIYGTDLAFVSAVFAKLAQRSLTDEELARFARFAGKSRAGAVRAVLRTPDFKTQRVNEEFRGLLRRDPTEDEMRKLSKLDRLALLTKIAAMEEFRTEE